MSVDQSREFEAYSDSRPPLTEQAFAGIVENQVLEVVFEPHMEDPHGKKALGHLEQIAHLDDDQYGQSADFYRIKLSEDQVPVEQERTFVHEVLHIYFGGLATAMAIKKTGQASLRRVAEEHARWEEPQVEAETQRFYNEYPDVVRQTFDHFRNAPVT